jgi:hypothetical protein
MIDVACPRCGAVYHSELAHIGKQLRCVRCGDSVPIVESVEIDRTPVQRKSTIPSAGNHRHSQPVNKHRHTYGFAIIAVAISAVVVAFVFLRPSSDSQEKLSIAPRIQEETASKLNSNAKASDNFEVIDAKPAVDQEVASGEPKSKKSDDPRPTDYKTLPSGTRIEGEIDTSGRGELTVDNGTSEDAVVRLCDVSTNKMLGFFVESRKTFRLTGVPQGSYRLLFTTGLNWEELEDTFSWHPSYSEFDKTFEFSEQRDSKGVLYDSVSVTLNPVVFGNVKAKPITREEFLRGHRHVNLQR